MNDPDFVSCLKSTEIERKVGVHLFLRGEYYYPKDMMTKSWLFLNIPYRLYPIIEAHCKSMLVAISFPPEQSEIEAEFQVDFRLDEGVEIFKQAGHASFSKTDPFVPFDAISFAVVSADFWRIQGESLKEDLIKKHGEADETGNISIPMYIDIVKDEEANIVEGNNNPKVIEFQNEFNTLLQEEKELEYKAVKLSALDSIESDSNYPTFFKLVVADEQA
jgi:hypothetical protein